MSEQISERERPSRLERLLGDRPGAIAVRLILVSILVGFLMSIFGLNAQGILNGAIELVRDALADSTGVLRSLWSYLLTGAALVVPIWLLLRLTARR
ncbi:MAG TPA: DUF6460 domain-containing protein [Devosia sp.]|nr:DUF6460 domain-containing protein [Devosia sp.]